MSSHPGLTSTHRGKQPLLQVARLWGQTQSMDRPRCFSRASWICGAWATVSVSLSWKSVLNPLITFRVCQHLYLAQVCSVMHFPSLVTRVSDTCFLAFLSRILRRTLSQGGVARFRVGSKSSEMATISPCPPSALLHCQSISSPRTLAQGCIFDLP